MLKVFRSKRLIVLNLLLLFIMAFCMSSCTHNTPLLIDDFNRLSGKSNALNNESYIRNMYSFNGDIYIFQSPSLYKINKDGSLNKIMTQDYAIDESFFFNGYFYYYQIDNYNESIDLINSSWSLCSLNLLTKEIKEIMSFSLRPNYILSYNDKIVMIDGHEDRYIEVNNECIQVTPIDNVNQPYYVDQLRVGNFLLLAEYMPQDFRLYIVKQESKKKLLLETDPCNIQVLRNGCLFIYPIPQDRIHLPRTFSSPLAWIVRPDGIIHELMKLDGYVYSVGNICGSEYICSFSRFKDEHIFYNEKYLFDKMEGTWVINLETLESKKISKKIYEDLFVIGDNIIGVDKNNRFSIIRQIEQLMVVD